MRKGLKLSLAVVVGLGIYGYGLGAALAAEVLPPSIMPVVILSGSDYKMGYQYGQQAGQYIEMTKDEAWANALQTSSYDEVIRALKIAQYYTKKYAPEAIEQMKGIADGASGAGYKISYIDALLINAGVQRPKISKHPPDAADEKLPPEECSFFAAWGSTTKDKTLICANSHDSGPIYKVVIVAFPDNGNSYISSANPGELARFPCMNSKGLFIGSASGFAIIRDIDSIYGIPRPCAYQHLIRFANTAPEARDMFLGWEYPGSWNIPLVDVQGNSFIIEATGALKTVRKPGDFGETDFIYCTNNYFTDKMQEAAVSVKRIDHAGWLGMAPNSISRNLELWNMLHNYRGKVDLEFTKMMWRYPGTPPPYPPDSKVYHATKGEIRSRMAGWSQIATLQSDWVWIALPNDRNGVAYICTGPAARVAYGPGDFQIAGTNTFFKLILKSNPAAVVEATNKDAHAYITEAYRKLMRLNYTDNTGYAALKELFSLANAEYYEGIIWTNKALLAQGDESLLKFAKAATAFTRSQAHAKQVYNALVPPATSPEGLGLKPYGGSWADWLY